MKAQELQLVIEYAVHGTESIGIVAELVETVRAEERAAAYVRANTCACCEDALLEEDAPVLCERCYGGSYTPEDGCDHHPRTPEDQ